MKMNTLLVRMWALVSMIALASASAISAPNGVDVEQFKARLQNLSETAQAQVVALDDQVASALDENAKADLEQKIEALKRQTEIQRLQILLEWAQAAGDETRANEVQTALNMWLNPPQPQVMPQVDREIPAPAVTPSSNGTR
jgi:hypothetical protein